jgi:8-hydroxy-5-deazaflavin:NADPH oxidoreductase
VERPRYRIGILGGTGAQGTGLALRLSAADHDVTIGSRDAAKARKTAAELATRIAKPVKGADNRSACGDAEIVFLTVPYAAQRATVEEVLAELAGKILVDTTVPLQPPKVGVVQLPDGRSAVAAIQERVGKSVRVISAFQNVSAQHLGDLAHAVDCDVLVCGDDREACETVIALAADIGLRGLYAGPIANSVAAEALTSVLITINRRYKVPGGAGVRITGIPESGRSG